LGLPEFQLLMTLRDAREGDLPAIVEIYNATIPSRMVTADLEPVTVEARRPWFDAHQSSRRPIWVLTGADGEIRAWLSFDTFYPRAAYDGTAMIAVYVSPAASALREWPHPAGSRRRPRASFWDCTPLLGYIFGHNGPSLRLFESQGFERWGNLPRVAVLDGVEARPDHRWSPTDGSLNVDQLERLRRVFVVSSGAGTSFGKASAQSSSTSMAVRPDCAVLLVLTRAASSNGLKSAPGPRRGLL
jgi:phosphinothricin acetyltransferase